MLLKLKEHNSHLLVRSIASQLNVKSKTDCLEESLQLPSTVGKGSVTSFKFDDGISLFIIDAILEVEWQLAFTEIENSLLHFNFLVDGKVRHTFNDGEIRYQLIPLQNSITASPVGSTEVFTIPPFDKITFAILLIERKEYLSVIDCYEKSMHKKMAELFRDVEGKKCFFFQGDFTILVSRLILQIIQDKNIGLVRSIFIESQVLELLSRQISRIQDDLSMLGRRLQLREHDAERIKLARKILVEDLKVSIPIETLAKKVGINQQKLKQGFKLIYETTILQYVIKERMLRASLLLLGDYSVKQAAAAVGYDNSSHFSKKFKDYYGVLPKDYIKSVQKRIYVDSSS